MMIKWLYGFSLSLLGSVLLLPAVVLSADNTHLRVIGGLATGNRFTKLEQPFWNKKIKELSQGKFSAELIPFDQAGVPAQEMLRMMQLGVLPIAALQLSQIATKYPEFIAMDLAGYHDEFNSLKAHTAKFRPQLDEELKSRFGVKLLSVYAYPGQMVFCNSAFADLSELRGRRIRVSSASAADFFEALGAQSTITGFAEIMPNMRNKNFDCVVTSALSAHSLGLHLLMTHMHAMPINFGISVLAVNQHFWDKLPTEFKALLEMRLPNLEQEIWQDANEDMRLGAACVTGDSKICTRDKLGSIRIVPMSNKDNALRRKVVNDVVMPKWHKRCGERCLSLLAKVG